MPILRNPQIQSKEECNMQMTELTFQFSKMRLNSEMIKTLFNQQQLTQIIQKRQKIILKFTFYCLQTNTRLIQKTQKASIFVKNQQTQQDNKNSDVSYCFQTKKQIKFKVTFPKDEDNKIQCKVQIMGREFYKRHRKQLNNNKVNRKMISFVINLQEWRNEIQKQQLQKQEQNIFKPIVHHEPKLKQIKILLTKQQNIKQSPLSPSPFDKKQTPHAQINTNNLQAHLNFQSYICFNINQYQSQSTKFINNEPKLSKISIISQNGKQKNIRKKSLQVISRVVNQKIAIPAYYNINLIQSPQQRHNHYKFLTLNNYQSPSLNHPLSSKISRARSEALLNKINRSNPYNDFINQNREQTSKYNFQNSYRRKLTFKQQLKELLSQVKEVKRQRQVQKNVYAHIQKINLSKISKKNPYKNCQNSIMPSNMPKSPIFGKMTNSITQYSYFNQQNQQQNNFNKINQNQLFHRILRVQDRLNSYQKVKRIEKENFIKI